MSLVTLAVSYFSKSQHIPVLALSQESDRVTAFVGWRLRVCSFALDALYGITCYLLMMYVWT